MDLPGYGYAKLSKKEIEKINLLITNYIMNSKKLFCLFLLIDSRHPEKQKNIDFINWLGEKNIPFCIIFTKIDKLSKNKLNINTKLFEKILSKNWKTIPEIIISSSKNKIGKKELFDFIEKHM